MPKTPKLNGNTPATQHDLGILAGEFTHRMDALEMHLDQMQKETKAEFARLHTEFTRFHRVQEAMLNTLQAIDIRTKDMPSREEFDKHADRIFALETKT